MRSRGSSHEVRKVGVRALQQGESEYLYREIQLLISRSLSLGLPIYSGTSGFILAKSLSNAPRPGARSVLLRKMG